MAGELCKIVKALAGWFVCDRHRIAHGRAIDGRGDRGGSECAHFSSRGVVPACHGRERRGHRKSIGRDVRETAHVAENGSLRWNTRGKQNALFFCFPGTAHSTALKKSGWAGNVNAESFST